MLNRVSYLLLRSAKGPACLTGTNIKEHWGNIFSTRGDPDTPRAKQIADISASAGVRGEMKPSDASVRDVRENVILDSSPNKSPYTITIECLQYILLSQGRPDAVIRRQGRLKKENSSMLNGFFWLLRPATEIMRV